MRLIRGVYPSDEPASSAFWAGGITEWDDWDVEKAVDEGLKTCYAFYAGVTLLKDWVGQPPWIVRRKIADGVEDLPDHPLMEVVRNPWPGEEWDFQQSAIDLHKSLAGNAFQLIIQVGDTVQLKRLRPENMGVDKDRKGNVVKWVYPKGATNPERYDPEAVIHHRFFDPGDDVWGLAPLQAASRIVDTMNAGLLWNKSSMANRVWSDGMIAPKLGEKVGLTEQQHNDFRKAIKKDLSGPTNARKIIVPGFPAEFVPFGLSPAEMDFLASFERWEDAIFMVLGLHAEALGRSGATFANKEWAIAAAWKGPVPTRLRQARSVYNRAFGPLFNTSWPPRQGEIYLDFDLTGTPGVMADFRDKIDMLGKLCESGLPFDAASQRLELGLPDFPGSDMSWRPINMIPASMVTEPPEPIEEEGRSTRTNQGAVREAYYRSIDSKKSGWDRKARSLIRALFETEGRAVASAVEGGNLKPSIDLEKWRKTLRAVWSAVVESLGDEVIADLNGARSVRAVEWDPFAAALKSYIERHVANSVKLIEGTTQDGIQRAIDAGVAEGESYAQIGRRIRALYDQYSVSRAMTIAWTEVHGASGYGMHEAARQSGVVETKTWLSAGDDRVRDSHAAMDGETVNLNDLYSNGLQFPGDPSGPGEEIVMCRCVESYGTKGA